MGALTSHIGPNSGHGLSLKKLPQDPGPSGAGREGEVLSGLALHDVCLVFQKLAKLTIALNGHALTYSSTPRNLGVIFHLDLSFNSHITDMCSLFRLRSIPKIRNMLTQSDAKKHISAFITTSRVDSYNSLLSVSTRLLFWSVQTVFQTPEMMSVMLEC